MHPAQKSKLVAAAIAGLSAGLSACGGSNPPAQSAGDPAKASDKHSCGGSDKHACGSGDKHACSDSSSEKKSDEAPAGDAKPSEQK